MSENDDIALANTSDNNDGGVTQQARDFTEDMFVPARNVWAPLSEINEIIRDRWFDNIIVSLWLSPITLGLTLPNLEIYGRVIGVVLGLGLLFLYIKLAQSRETKLDDLKNKARPQGYFGSTQVTAPKSTSNLIEDQE